MATTFDAADRPTSTGFANDLDGRLTSIPARGGAPAKSLAYDALGRLVSATVAGVTRTYGVRSPRPPGHDQRERDSRHPPPLRGADEHHRPAPRRRLGGHPQRRHRLDRCRPRRLGARAHRLASLPGQRPRRPRGDPRRQRQRGSQPPARPLGRPPALRPRRLPGLRLPGQPDRPDHDPRVCAEPAGTTRSSPPSPPRTHSSATPSIPPAATSTPTAPATRWTGRMRREPTGTGFRSPCRWGRLPRVPCSAPRAGR